VAIADPRLRKGWELQAYAWLFTDRFWRATPTSALRSGSRPRSRRSRRRGSSARSMRPSRTTPATACPRRHSDGRDPWRARPAFPKENGEELARLIPSSELLLIPEVGHAVNLEGQRAVNGALRALWKRVP